MEAPLCKSGHRPVHCQRWRQQPFATIDGVPHRRYWCPVCKRFTFVANQRTHPSHRSPRNPWWRCL
jgi:hypothetical protein